MELYEDETDAEVYKLGIHTVDESPSIDPVERMMDSLYHRAQQLVGSGKFVTHPPPNELRSANASVEPIPLLSPVK